MVKFIKGESVHNIITDDDVILTSSSKMGKTLGEVLDEQQSDIDRLKSNIKYIYAYGGVGVGSGSGGNGSGTTDKPLSFLITLGGATVNGGDPIVLDGKKNYTLYIKANNAGGRSLFVGYTTDGSNVSENMMRNELNGSNKYKTSIDLYLVGNNTLNIAISDDEGNIVEYYSQRYIVDSDIFNVTLNYKNADGEIKTYSDKEPYECFVYDPNKFERFIEINYSIYLTNYSNVGISWDIEGINEEYDMDVSDIDSPIRIPLDRIKINNKSILSDECSGTYTFTAKLSYTITGEAIVRDRSFSFSVIPYDLYINVRTVGDILYNSKEALENNYPPDKYINQGTPLAMYSKVFEGEIYNPRHEYSLNFYAYDAILDSEGHFIEWKKINERALEDNVFEREESKNGVYITFSTEGSKKIEIHTTDKSGVKKIFEKYLYVKSFDYNCKWYDVDRVDNLLDSYFKANQNPAYNLFPQISSGNGVMSLLTSSNKEELSEGEWSTKITEGNFCTVITIGIQVSDINSEDAKIIDIYNANNSNNTKPYYSLSVKHLSQTGDNENEKKIAIPTEVLDKNDNSKYHLVQIIRYISDVKNDKYEYEDSLYIDGLLEFAKKQDGFLKIGKLVLNNINICYNLINVQYFGYKRNGYIFNPDAYAYQYWLSYKEKYINSGLDKRLSEEEYAIIRGKYLDRISFDGENVVVEPDIVKSFASISDLPTVIFKYNCANEKDSNYQILSNFMNSMWMGRDAGDNSFGNKNIDLYWISEKTPEGEIANGSDDSFGNCKVTIPSNLTGIDNVNAITDSNWEIDLQGTSTKRNRIKNFSLRIANSGDNGKILFSPKFDIGKPETFLPDLEWTIKADIADSAHANNTSIGKFVNRVCTKIDTNIHDGENKATNFIKNTLEGIPVLLYFMCTGKDDDGVTDITKIYYFGIYNFNLGRKSYYNLGYTGGIDVTTGRSDFMTVFKNIEDGIKNDDETKYVEDDKTPFVFAVGEGKLSESIAIAEIQANLPEFDFHQYQDSLLFKGNNNSDIACMFGTDEDIMAYGSVGLNNTKRALKKLVESVAKAGWVCFSSVGRTKDDFITSQYHIKDSDGEIIWGTECVNRYLQQQIPHPKNQMSYEPSGEKIWKEDLGWPNEPNLDYLKTLIIPYQNTDGTYNKPILDYTSASEYYTICMAFGMVDSILKNMNLKNFKSLTEEPKFHCAFYDMDCALEENNSGVEKISYLAATDYWYSERELNNRVNTMKIIKDYWNSAERGDGFDFTSSYLFAVVKYAYSILMVDDPNNRNHLYHYPQDFWAHLRQSNGELRSVDHFMENYFKSGVTTTFEYLASLNYRVKYLYRESILDDNGVVIGNKYLSNVGAFNGSRRIKAKNWLSKRLRFMDFMMNIVGVNIDMGGNYVIPSPNEERLELLSRNPDINILQSAFDTSDKNKALCTFTGQIEIYSPEYTPFIMSQNDGTSIRVFLLPGGDKPNVIEYAANNSVNQRLYGSKMFKSVDKIETMFTEYYGVSSDNIERIIYDGKSGTSIASTEDGFTINAKSATEIKLDIPNMGGILNISDCISLEKINISNSKFYGSFSGFPNLKEVNISGVNAGSNDISVSGSDYLTGGNFIISGSDVDHKTTLGALIISGVTGNFECRHTNIGKIQITNTIDKSSEFSISNDSALSELNLVGFKKVTITSCNNLSTLIIDNALEVLEIDLNKLEGETTSNLKTIYLDKIDDDGESTRTGVEGVFDFTNYPNLTKVTLKNCDHLVHVKLPDNMDENGNAINIKTDGMSNNPNLEWIDTGSVPCYNGDGDGYKTGSDNKEYPTYSNPKTPKLILCREGAFENCPKYAMLRSDWYRGDELFGDVDNVYDDYMNIAYTNIIVSNECKSLKNTFSVNTSDENDKFNMKTAIRFIEKCVADDVKAGITSLSGCFRGRSGVQYNNNLAALDIFGNHNSPELTEYTSLKDISYMYENTGVDFISEKLLSLNTDQNNNEKENVLKWDNFITNMDKIGISKVALQNISYRIDSYSNIAFNCIYEYTYENQIPKYIPADSLDICDFFCPIEDVNGKPIPFEHITSISSLNFGVQNIDFSKMFNLFPNVNSISNFLNGNLSKYNMNGLLKPCNKIISIVNSFNDNNINASDAAEIDLYEFFNWEGNTTDIKTLFEGTNYLSNGFKIKKHITFENLKTVLANISNYTNLTRLNNIFSYCTITGYDGREIKFPDNSNTMDNIVNVSNLFEYCSSEQEPNSQNNADICPQRGLNIGRSFFEKLPNVQVASRTFANTYLSSSLSYDFFHKRVESTDKNAEDVYILKNGDYHEAKLYECVYKSHIYNLDECFSNTKFVKCKNWFDPDDSNFKPTRNYITDVDGNRYDTCGFEYYKLINGDYERCILDNDIIDDCLDNYTNFVPYNEVDCNDNDEAKYTWSNHDLKREFTYYGNIVNGKPFDYDNVNDIIQKTYCCLPPDFLYGCNSNDISPSFKSIFANSNITGVIPRNLTKKVKNISLPNIFKNVNIMPNLEYYYDSENNTDVGILNEVIDTVEIYDVSDSEVINDKYTVVFRDEYGRLKKRKPIKSDRNLGQFVYVPANFTTTKNLNEFFNFRYNLPLHWDIYKSDVNGGDLTDSSYKTTKSFNEAINSGKLDVNSIPYHSQYYFLIDKCVNWDNVTDATYMFIKDDQDIDFSNNNIIRQYYMEVTDTNRNAINAWTLNGAVKDNVGWENNVKYFHIDLNLCGKKNEYNMIEDYGCPVSGNEPDSEKIKTKKINLNNFVSGTLTIFLNGRIFDKSFEVGYLNSSRHGSSFIIDYKGFGRNLILPNFNSSTTPDNIKFISLNSNTVCYDFMLDDEYNETSSKQNYVDYAKYKNENNNFNFKDGYKYIFR